MCDSTAPSAWRRADRKPKPRTRIKEPDDGRSTDHRCMPHAARHRQGRQGRALGHSPAATGCRRPTRAQRAHRHRYRRCRRHHLGHQRPGRPAERRHRPHVGAGCRLRRAGQRRDARSLLRLGHHQRQHGGGLDHVGRGGSGDRRRHRDDVDDGTPRRRPVDDGLRQSAASREAPAIAPGRLRRRGRDPGGHQPGGHRPPGAFEPAASRDRDREWLFQQKRRAGFSRGRQTGARSGRISAPADDAGGPGRAEARLRGHGRFSARRERHDLSQAYSREVSRSRRSTTSTMPATRRAWSMARRQCCWRRRATPRNTA